MALDLISLGTAPTGTGGDTNRQAFTKVNAALDLMNSALPDDGARLLLDGGEVTANQPVVEVAQTWNNGGEALHALDVTITDTASAAGSTLLRLKAGEAGDTTKFQVGKEGSVTAGSPENLDATIKLQGADRSGELGFSAWGNGLAAKNDFDIMADNAKLRFVDGSASTRYGVIVGLETGLLGVMADSGAQTLAVFNTTDTVNFERLVLRGTGTVFEIRPEAGGAGTERSLHISGLPTSNPGPGILWNNAGTPAIGT